MKKVAVFIVSVILMLSVAACVNGEGGGSGKTFDPNDNLMTDQVFFDDFTDRDFTAQNWAVSTQKWGSGFNNGVKQENVSFTKDGILVLQSNGDYYNGSLGEKGIRTGAALISKQVCGPGRFEAKMKVLPRFGATTALWTYFFGEADGVAGLNQEIDIEMNVKDDFAAVWNTSYHTTSVKESYKTTSEIINNDGEWHTYKFEWHTAPERIDYYIDDVLTHTALGVVPWCGGRLWVGNWFPPNWAGNPDFATDYMLVDYVRYTPYANNPYTETNPTLGDIGEYPTTPIDAVPIANLISDPGFEGCANAQVSAWNLKNSSTSTVVNGGASGAKELRVTKNNVTYDGLAHQLITGMREGFELKLTAKAKFSAGSEGYILVDFMPQDDRIIGDIKLPFNTADSNFADGEFYEKEITFMLPKNCRRIDVNFIVSDGTVTFDDIFLNNTKRI